MCVWDDDDAVKRSAGQHRASMPQNFTKINQKLYASCKTAHPKVSFLLKIVDTFRPDDFRIERLVKRKLGVSSASVKIDAHKDNDCSSKSIKIVFSTKIGSDRDGRRKLGAGIEWGRKHFYSRKRNIVECIQPPIFKRETPY